MPRTPVFERSSKSRYGQSIRRVTLRERYEAQMRAPDLLSLRDEISLIGAKIADTLEKLDASGVNFEEMLELQQQLDRAVNQNDMPTIAILAAQMGESIQRGVAESVLWRDLYEAIEHRRKLVETEMKTLNSIGAMISMEQCMQLVSKLLAAVTLHIGDKEALRAIHGEFSRVLDLVPTRVNDSLSDFSEK